MSTITKKELIDRIAEKTQAKRVLVKKIVQELAIDWNFETLVFSKPE
ncbi:MAG: hypothetical protein ACYSR3_11285 [Planctomycetota bacterium]|jgi:nucleoid DNA-binding protein